MKVPLKRTLAVLAAAFATDVEGSTIIGKVPFAGTVTAVGYIPAAAITGVDSNTRKVAVVNRTSAGLGTVEVAALQFNSGVNGVAFDEKTITLSETAANLEVAAGDVLTFTSTAPGTGLADPGGMVIVEITREND